MDGALTQARSIVAGAAGVSAQDGRQRRRRGAAGRRQTISGRRVVRRELVYAGEIATSAMQLLCADLAARHQPRWARSWWDRSRRVAQISAEHLRQLRAQRPASIIVDLGVNVAARCSSSTR